MFSILKAALILLIALTSPACIGPKEFTPFSEREMPVQPLRYQLDVGIDFDREYMNGKAEITVINPRDEAARYIPILLYRLLRAKSVVAQNGAPVPFDQRVLTFEDFDRLQVNYMEIQLSDPIEPGEQKTVTIEYEGYLLGASESGMLYVKDHINPEFTILRSDAYAFPCLSFPSFFASRKAGLPTFEWEARITVPKTLVVANGGQFVDKRIEAGKATYRYKSIKPSWRMDFAVGGYEVMETEGLKVFHFLEDEEGARSAVQSFRQAYETLSEWFGPLHDFQSFAILEVPEGYGGQADVTCILMTADAFRDPARAFLIYHEATHLWNVTPTDLPAPRIEEGLAVFLQWLLTDRYMGQEGELVKEKMEAVANRLRGRFEADLDVKSIPMIDYGRTENTDLSYSVGALLFAIVYQLVTPEEFNAIVGGFYQDHWNSGASTDDLVAFAEANSQSDLAKVFEDWVYTTAFVEKLESGMSLNAIAETYR